MSKYIQFVLAAALLMAVSGCGVKENVKKLVGLGGEDRTVYKGPVYPAASKTAVAFQPSQVDKSCRVFAESLVLLPAKVSGQDIAGRVLAEANQRGADQVLIGRTRQGKDNSDLQFLYYGPAAEYLCADQCGGWKFGYDLWEKQGEWVTLGYAEWGKAGAVYETPLVMQLAMLRCQ